MDKISMRKGFSEYDVYVFDLDGTLYFQKKLRLIMASRLAGYYLCHIWKLKELLIVKKFREVREKWDDIQAEDTKLKEITSATIDDAQYEYVAKKMGSSAATVKSVIKKWIYDNPLDAVAASKDIQLAAVIDNLKKLGKKVAVFSDYPTEDKLKALGITVDGQYCSAGENIGELKPSPRGLELIMNDFGFEPSQVLMIGDRLEKDGECAVNAGVDYLVLSRKQSGRCYSLFVLD